MEVLGEGLAPGVQDRGDPDRATQMPRIAPEGEQRVGSRAEEEGIEDARIPLGQRIEQMREGEDDVEVGNREQVGSACREPPFLGERLALRAVPIATGVVGDPHGAAAVTRLPMPAKGGGPTGRDGPQGSVLHGREPVRASVGVAVVSDDVRQLEPRTGDRDRRADRHGAHDQPCGGANRARRSSGESGPTSVWRVS